MTFEENENLVKDAGEEVTQSDAHAELEAALVDLKEGQVVTGTVAQVADDGVYVNVGYKSEGFIPLSELSYRTVGSAHDVAKVGDEIKVVVLSLEGQDGAPRLSKRRAEEAAAWERLEKVHEAGEILEATVAEAVKGGLVLDLGLRAFLPASQVERGYVNDLNKYVGETVRVKVIELDRQKNRVILSRRIVLEEERESAKKAFWSEVEEGQIRSGVVKSLVDFGAFIDLGGVDGLLHVSEMSYGRIKHPSQVLAEGQELDVKVLRLDPEKGKVSLGLKQVLPDPWANVAEKYPEGATVTGTVARLASFGAFVELEPGVDALIHISQLADRRVNTPSEVVEVGQEVQALVTQVRSDERRISLSLRALAEPSAPEAAPAEQAAYTPADEGVATIGEILKAAGAEAADEPTEE